MTLFRAGGYGYHWTPCGQGGGSGAAIITVIIAVLVIGGGGMGAAASALTSLLVTILVILCAVAVLGITVAVVVVRRSRRRDAEAGVLWRPVAPGAVTAEPVRPQVTATERPAIAAPQPVIINIFGADERAAALIRQALPGSAGDNLSIEEE